MRWLEKLVVKDQIFAMLVLNRNIYLCFDHIKFSTTSDYIDPWAIEIVAELIRNKELMCLYANVKPDKQIENYRFFAFNRYDLKTYSDERTKLFLDEVNHLLKMRTKCYGLRRSTEKLDIKEL